MNVRDVAWLAVLLSAAVLAAEPAASGLKVVVLDGENAVNIVRDQTAVQPVIQVRDRNDVPVAGATVVFRIRGKSATFSNKIKLLTMPSDSEGRAAMIGLRARGN